jgi:hypothetical protein
MDPNTGRPVDFIQLCSGLVDNSEYYLTYSSVSIIIVYVRLIQYFTFSKDLSSFQEIIFSASFDLLFFILLWVVMLFGFSFAFFTIYGLQIQEFQRMTSALLSSFKMST